MHRKRKPWSSLLFFFFYELMNSSLFSGGITVSSTSYSAISLDFFMRLRIKSWSSLVILRYIERKKFVLSLFVFSIITIFSFIYLSLYFYSFLFFCFSFFVWVLYVSQNSTVARCVDCSQIYEERNSYCRFFFFPNLLFFHHFAPLLVRLPNTLYKEKVMRLLFFAFSDMLQKYKNMNSYSCLFSATGFFFFVLRGGKREIGRD